MADLQLPVQLGGNASWARRSERDLVVATTEAVPGVPLAWFPAAPEDEMWSFERVVLQAHPVAGPEVPINMRLFVDDVQTPNTQAPYDERNVVDVLTFVTPLEVLCRPYPIQLYGGTRLGIAFGDGTQLLTGLARAQITTYVRAAG